MRYLLFLILLAVTVKGQTPVDYLKWQHGERKFQQQFGGSIRNYPTGDSWATIVNDWVLEGDSVVYCNTAALKTRVNKQGVSTVMVSHDGVDYTVSQRLKGIGWINTATRGSLWIDSTMNWPTPTVGDSIIKWTGVSPGVDYQILKGFGKVPHTISYKPAFLDSAVTLYNQRSDSLDIALANVMVYTISATCDYHDVEIGDVDRRTLKQIGSMIFELSRQRVGYPGSDTLPQPRVRQYWERRGSNIVCVEYVMMSAIKQIHEFVPTGTIWHNVEVNMSSSADIDGTSIREGSGGNNDIGGWHTWQIIVQSNNDYSVLVRWNDLDDSLPDNAVTDSAYRRECYRW
ncbi:MAG: hypothetical protein ACYS21_07105 [Planctomycetota bacterium]|jgi:hypothetical protein